MPRIRTILIIATLGGGCLGAGACGRTPEEAHGDAVEAQRTASKDIHHNNQQAQESIDKAERDSAKSATAATKDTNDAVSSADKKIAEAKQQARQDNAEVQAKANEKIREANVDMIADKADARVWGQKKIDGLNNMIDDARVKAQSAPAKARASLEAGLKEVQTQRDGLTAELASVETEGAKKTAAFKTRLDSEVDRLKLRVEKLERSL
jgi:hypothetical protein